MTKKKNDSIFMPSKKKASKSSHYVDNKKLLEYMIEYKNAVDESKRDDTPKPQVDNYIAQAILDICRNLSNKPQFFNYMFKEEMIMDAVENCIRYIDNFDPEKSSNPFAYFSQVSYWAFVRRIKKEKKELYTKCKYIDHVDIFNMDVDEKNIDNLAKAGKIKISEQTRKYMEDFIETYEQN